MICTKDNFCFHEPIFYRQIKLISYRSEFWHIRRKSAVLYSKWLFCQKNGVFMNHIIKLNFRWKNKMFSELFTTQKIEKKYMTFLTTQSLLGILIFRYTNRTKIETDMVFIPGTHPETSSNWSKKPEEPQERNVMKKCKSIQKDSLQVNRLFKLKRKNLKRHKILKSWMILFWICHKNVLSKIHIFWHSSNFLVHCEEYSNWYSKRVLDP